MSNIFRNKSLLFLTLITLLAAVLRISVISSYPVSLYWDETAIGYNAYSIATTGKDEYGQVLPLLFRSFDDYKMPGYIYLTALFVKVIGLSEFSVRLPSALLGVGAVITTYFLVIELLKSVKIKNQIVSLLSEKKETIALLSSLLLAISPWHIQFSRTGFEANGGLFFYILGVLLFVIGRKDVKFFFLSFVSFAVGMYFYRSLYIVTPLMLFSLCLIFFPEYLRVKKRYLILGILLFFLLISPIVPQMLSENGLKRSKQVSVTNDVQEKLNESSQKIAAGNNRLLDRVLYNRRLIIAETYLSGYVSHFSPRFLFTTGDTNGRHDIAFMGMLYLWEFPFLIIGLLLVFFLPRKIAGIIIIWIVISPIAASLSSPTPHALRSLNMLPIPMILTSFGITYCLYLLSQKARVLSAVTLTSVVIGSFFLYLNSYYRITPTRTADDWADGYKQLVSTVTGKEERYDKIIITGAYWQPYIYFLFYKHYDPTLFQTKGTNISFEKYYFGGTEWDKEKGRVGLTSEEIKKISQHKKTLIALTPEEYTSFKDKIKNTMTVTNSFGKTRFVLGEIK